MRWLHPEWLQLCHRFQHGFVSQSGLVQLPVLMSLPLCALSQLAVAPVLVGTSKSGRAYLSCLQMSRK